MAELNKSVPSFSTHVGQFRLRFPNERRVQKPLQEAYSLFIDLNLFIITYFNQRDPSESILRFRSEITASVDTLQELMWTLQARKY
jgi:hypothetical protein